MNWKSENCLKCKSIFQVKCHNEEMTDGNKSAAKRIDEVEIDVIQEHSLHLPVTRNRDFCWISLDFSQGASVLPRTKEPKILQHTTNYSNFLLFYVNRMGFLCHDEECSWKLFLVMNYASSQPSVGGKSALLKWVFAVNDLITQDDFFLYCPASNLQTPSQRISGQNHNRF